MGITLPAPPLWDGPDLSREAERPRVASDKLAMLCSSLQHPLAAAMDPAEQL
jgi:hypothetical protein